MENSVRQYYSEQAKTFRSRPVAVSLEPEVRGDHVVDLFAAPQRQEIVLADFRSERANKRKVVQYEITFDREQARELQRVKLAEPETYTEKVKAFEGFINMQLLTALGERFNRGISEYAYRIHDGKLYGEHGEEPFEDVLERGRVYREIHGTAIDHPREAAEVVGFRKIQKAIVDEKTPVGTIMLNISQPGGEGSIYKHNFYDGFCKRDDGTVQVIRFSSALSAEETVAKIRELSPNAVLPADLSDASLLSHPVRIDQSKDRQLTLQDLHHLLHRDHDVMSEEDFALVKQFSDTIRLAYISTLKDDPESQELPLLLNAYWNSADQTKASLDKGRRAGGLEQRPCEYSKAEILQLGLAPVRLVDTGCGLSDDAGMGESALGVYGVAAFGISRPEDDPNLCKCGGEKPHFHCPGTKTIEMKQQDGSKKKEQVACRYKIIVGKGITMCPDCGEMKRC